MFGSLTPVRPSPPEASPPEAPAFTAPATIAGTAEVGQVLTATPGTVTGNPTPTSEYQWYRGASEITGETGLTYTAVLADDGESITWKHTATNVAGSAESTSNGITIGGIALANIDIMRSAGHEIPDPNEWWIEHPTTSDLKSNLKAPHLNDPGGQGISTRRFMPNIPLTSSNYDNFDYNDDAAGEQAINGWMESSSYPQQHAMLSWYKLEVDSDTTGFNTLQASAKSMFGTGLQSENAWNESYILYGQFYTDHAWSALLSLDWLVWDDVAEFEAAFARVKSIIDHYESTNIQLFHDAHRGYMAMPDNCSHHYALYALLAMIVSGVNPGGAADLWADSVFDNMDADPLNDTSVYWSPFHFLNQCSMAGKSTGGGEDWGRLTNAVGASFGTGAGGYEFYIMIGVTYYTFFVDAATNNAYQLHDKCLYWKHKYKSMQVIEEEPVSRRLKNQNDASYMAEVEARRYGDTIQGRTYAWYRENRPPWDGINVAHAELRALSGPHTATAALPPASSYAGRIGQRWVYKEDMSDVDGSFMFFTTCRDLSLARVEELETWFYFKQGNVGLVDGCAGRGNGHPGLGNGMAITVQAPNGEPRMMGSLSATDSWSYGGNSKPYSTDGHEFPPEVANELVHLIGTSTFTLQGNGHYTWNVDYMETGGSSGRYRTGWVSQFPLSVAEADHDFDPVNKVYQVTYRVQFSGTTHTGNGDNMYVGWHFAPNFVSTPITDGFEFGDGTDLIRVLVEGLNGTSLTKQVRNQWDYGTHTMLLDHYEVEGDTFATAPERMKENVGYAPTGGIVANTLYTVRVTCSMNPSEEAPAWTADVDISGTLDLNEVLTVVPGTATGTPTPTITYQWYRSDDVLGTGEAAISGETGTTYTTTGAAGADDGKFIGVKATATNSEGTAVSTSTRYGINAIGYGNYTIATVGTFDPADVDQVSNPDAVDHPEFTTAINSPDCWWADSLRPLDAARADEYYAKPRRLGGNAGEFNPRMSYNTTDKCVDVLSYQAFDIGSNDFTTIDITVNGRTYQFTDVTWAGDGSPTLTYTVDMAEVGGTSDTGTIVMEVDSSGWAGNWTLSASGQPGEIEETFSIAGTGDELGATLSGSGDSGTIVCNGEKEQGLPLTYNSHLFWPPMSHDGASHSGVPSTQCTMASVQWEMKFETGGWNGGKMLQVSSHLDRYHAELNCYSGYGNFNPPDNDTDWGRMPCVRVYYAGLPDGGSINGDVNGESNPIRGDGNRCQPNLGPEDHWGTPPVPDSSHVTEVGGDQYIVGPQSGWIRMTMTFDWRVPATHKFWFHVEDERTPRTLVAGISGDGYPLEWDSFNDVIAGFWIEFSNSSTDNTKDTTFKFRNLLVVKDKFAWEAYE